MSHLYRVKRNGMETLYQLNDDGVLSNETDMCFVGRNMTKDKCEELFTHWLQGEILECIEVPND